MLSKSQSMENIQKYVSIKNFDCVICCEIMIKPITLVCGHSFCQYCIKNDLFNFQNCPLCRRSIFAQKEQYQPNILLDQLILYHFKNDLNYQRRLKNVQKINNRRKTKFIMIKVIMCLINFGKKMIPFTTMCLAIYLLYQLKFKIKLLDQLTNMKQFQKLEELTEKAKMESKQIADNFQGSLDQSLYKQIFYKLLKYITTNYIKFAFPIVRI